ncbi:MAG: 3-oxoacyl-ACP reductase FabG [Bacteroidales bacterium]|nr:3-oxoacyl-ACP reductase FabG [Bacteroidales bacterium]
MKFDFTNKVVLITGATKGIGKKTADLFEQLGATLILTGTKSQEISRLNVELDAFRKVKYFCLDFLIDSSITDFFESIHAYDKIDVLINNAGINKIDKVYDFSVEDWESIMKVNLTGAFRMTREIGRKMKEQNSGKIINIASIFGTITKGKRNAYTASKAGLIGFTKTASVDLAPFNILVNAVSPGFIDTDLTRKILKEEEIMELAAQIPLERLGKPDEIAKLVAFLASEHNTYINGQNITIDGGFVNI